MCVHVYVRTCVCVVTSERFGVLGSDPDWSRDLEVQSLRWRDSHRVQFPPPEHFRFVEDRIPVLSGVHIDPGTLQLILRE